jgi:uncharacterized membrane protein YhfC
MAELRKIGVLSVMKISFVLNLVIGFVAALVMVVFTMVLSPLSGMAGAGRPSMMWGPIAIVAVPLIYGIVGALMAGLAVLVYNLLAARLGGIQVMILFPVRTDR